MATERCPIYPARERPEFKGAWDGPAWGRAKTVVLSHFRPESSDHRPKTEVKLLYGLEGVYGLFRVKDRYVRCVHRRHLDPVYKDSCVEFFVQPHAEAGYFNFEFNCGGTILASYIVDPKRTADGFADFKLLNKKDVSLIKIFHSQPRITNPEVQEPVTWFLEFYIPYALMEKYTERLEITPEIKWRGNFYKCGDDTSHPHWGAWSPVDKLNFHLPGCFGELVFMPHEKDE